MKLYGTENMDKWGYIRLISERGTHYGENGGVLDLLQWSGKDNTGMVTLEEAREFWEKYGDGHSV